MFKTIKENASAEVVEKKSKFIANIFYVESREEAENIIKEVNKKYHDARHNCYAYRIVSEDGIIEKARWAWSSTTNTDIISCPFEKIALSLDVSCIKENINGVRGIDKQDVMNCVSNLKEMMGSITADCLDFVNKEVSDIGFYDYNDVVAQIFRDRMRSTEKMASTLIHSFEIGINNIRINLENML